MSISQTTDFHFANYRFSFRKLQIFISQTTDFHFAHYRFFFRKLQISISQTTDFHFVSFYFVPFRFANYCKPKTNAFLNSECYWVLRTRTNKLFTFENGAYNFPEQYILRVLISLPTHKTPATLVVSAIVDDNYSCSSIYRYFGGLSLSISHTIFLSSAFWGY